MDPYQYYLTWANPTAPMQSAMLGELLDTPSSAAVIN